MPGQPTTPPSPLPRRPESSAALAAGAHAAPGLRASRSGTVAGTDGRHDHMDEPAPEGATRTTTRPSTPDGLSCGGGGRAAAAGARATRAVSGTTRRLRGDPAHQRVLLLQRHPLRHRRALLVLGRYSDALISVGLGLINAVISAVQEIRAKRKLDRLQLLDRAPVLVVRDGREVEVAPEEVVRGDVLRVRRGRPDRRRRAAARRAGRGRRVAAHRRVRPGRQGPGRRAALGQPVRRRARATSSPATSAPRATRAGSPPGPPGHHRRHPAAAADRVRRAAGDGPDRADERGDPRPGRARGLHACCASSRPRRCCPGWCPTACSSSSPSPTPRARPRSRGGGALVQQVNAVESVSERRRRVHRQDRHADHRAAHARRGRARSAARTRRRGGGARRVRPQRHAPRTSPPRAGRRAARRGTWTVRDEVPFASSLRWSGRVTQPDARHRGCSAHPTPSRPDLRRAAARPRPSPSARGRGLRVLVLARAADPGPGCATRTAAPRCPTWSRSRSSRSPTSCAPRSPTTDRPLPRGRAWRSRCSPATTRARSPRSPPRRARRRRARGGHRARRPRRRRPGPARRPHHRVRPGRARAEGAHRRLAAPAGPLRRDDRRRGQRRPRAQGAPRSAWRCAAAAPSPATSPTSCSSTTPSPRCCRPSARAARSSTASRLSMYVFLARVATQGLVILAVTMLGLGFPYSPTQVGLTLLTVGVPTLFLTFWARPTATDPHLLGNLARFVLPAARGHRRASAPPSTPTSTSRVTRASAPAARPAQVDQRLRELHRPDLHRRRLHRGRGDHRRPDRAVDVRLPRLVPADPVPRPARAGSSPPGRRPYRTTAGRPCWSSRCSSPSPPCCSSRRSTTTSGSPARRRRCSPACCPRWRCGSSCSPPPSGSGCSTGSSVCPRADPETSA